MKTIVRYMRDTADDINAWLEGIANRDPIRRMQAEMYFAELARLLEAIGGPPPGSISERGVSPVTYWWDFYPDLWVRFCVEDKPAKLFGLLGERSRRITILQLRDAPPILQEP